MITIPTDFQFSQASLQDYQTCALRFELRYLRRLSWPGIESEPLEEAERLARLGADFHRLIHQHLIGIPEAVLAEQLAGGDPDLQGWWQSYLADGPDLTDAALYPELTLTSPLRGYRLTARFDLLAVRTDGRFLIVDWKTARRKPPRDRLDRRIQTKVYPYLLARAGATLNNGRPVDPAMIRMLYWYPVAPAESEIFDYNAQKLDQDEQFLSSLIEQVKQATRSGDFPRVKDPKHCIYCLYRSYCDRGDRAGPVLAQEEDPQDTLEVLAAEWDQIAEIAF